MQATALKMNAIHLKNRIKKENSIKVKEKIQFKVDKEAAPLRILQSYKKVNIRSSKKPSHYLSQSFYKVSPTIRKRDYVNEGRFEKSLKNEKLRDKPINLFTLKTDSEVKESERHFVKRLKKDFKNMPSAGFFQKRISRKRNSVGYEKGRGRKVVKLANGSGEDKRDYEVGEDSALLFNEWSPKPVTLKFKKYQQSSPYTLKSLLMVNFNARKNKDEADIDQLFLPN